MGFLNLFGNKPASAAVAVALPTGSFTVDATGRIVSSTLPRNVPELVTQEIGQAVLGTLRLAAEAQLRLTEFTVNYAAFKLTAREMRGGAIIFLAPRAMSSK